MPPDMQTTTTSPLTHHQLTDLRRRRSVKWTEFPPDVLPMRIAEMDSALAAPITETLTRALLNGDTGYATPGQLPDRFADFAGRRYGWHPSAEGMRLVPDVMTGIVEVLRVATRPGDTVVVNVPGYPPYFSRLRQLGLRLRVSPLQSDDGGYRLDLDDLDRAFTSGAAAFLLCNPHNPTGTVFGRSELAAIAGLAARHDVLLVADEILAPLVQPGPSPHVPLPLVGDAAGARSVSVVSASKGWNLAGLKAALVVPGDDALPIAAALDEDLEEGAGLFGVLASEVAFAAGEPWLDELICELDGNRRLLADELARVLPEVGYRPPDAGFTAWLDLRALGLAGDPAAVLLDLARVGVSSGLRFDPDPPAGRRSAGQGFVRLNFATRPDLVVEAVRRIAAALR